MKESALSENTKVSSLAQDVIRHMLNTSEDLPQSIRDGVIDSFTAKLKVSGYGKEQIKRIVIAGLKGYDNKLKRANKLSKGIHIIAADGAASRYKKKLTAKSSWFKGKSIQESEEQRPDSPKPLPKQHSDTKTPRQSNNKNYETHYRGEGEAFAPKNSQKSPVSTVLFVPQTSLAVTVLLVD